jgi:hypothetical protein
VRTGVRGGTTKNVPEITSVNVAPQRMFRKSPREMWHHKECAGNHLSKCGTTKNVLEITSVNVSPKRMFWKSPREMWHYKEFASKHS